MKAAAVTRNEEALSRTRIPPLGPEAFRTAVITALAKGRRLAAWFSVSDQEYCAVLADDQAGTLTWLGLAAEGGLDSLTPVCPQAHAFERELAESSAFRPIGHPWLKPLRALRAETPGGGEFFRVFGEEVHEVAVGPVHAGVIEPGHFRFQCAGEKVLHLEIALGYQHRGVEQALRSAAPQLAVAIAETAAGDTSIGHALAYAGVLEALARTAVPPRALALRAVALELERMANHAGDLGALAQDVGYLPTSAHCGRLRGDLLNLTAEVCGNRFGRGLVRPGGVAFDLEPERAGRIRKRLQTILSELHLAMDLAWKSPSVMARWEQAGRLSRKAAIELGVVGPAARACGLARDVRQDFASGFYALAHIPLALAHGGDVFSRAMVRWLEIQRSAGFVLEQLHSLPQGGIRVNVGPLAPSSAAAALVEGWRGEICHVALTDGHGGLAAYKIVDPSFHNWQALALVMRNGEISDFPLCNKSFNLSYCGHDL
ncbi:MAG: hydrogenase [candidate division FCPU426 bacterium]